MRLTPTPEQNDIIEAAKNLKAGKVLKITAFAGAAKTTTLQMVSEEMPSQRFLYLAFNKAIVEENKGKFPSNVTIQTTHSLAYKHTVKGRKVCAGFRAAEISKKYYVPYSIAEMALRTLEFYFNSDLPSLKNVEGEKKL